MMMALLVLLAVDAVVGGGVVLCWVECVAFL